MSSEFKKREYGITGPESKSAQDKGLASAEWYASPIPRKRMKELVKRKNGPAIRDTLIWFILLIGTGFLAYYSWGTWWAIPAFFLYGILYTTPADSRWHECGHGTPFKTSWMKEAIYQLASFMSLRPATPWRWSHTRHHTDTYIVGRDPEIATERPPVWRIILMNYFLLYAGPKDIKRMFLHAFGIMTEQEKEYVPASEFKKTFWESRVYMFIFAIVLAACLYAHSILPAMFIILPSFYGAFLVLVFGMTQHIGLHEDVLDHRLNSRTIYMNPVLRFLYWNMNYHIEHHMFPMVPYHALSALHEEMKADCPQASRSLWEAYRDVIRAMLKQKTNPAFTIERSLPPTAMPYKYGPDDTAQADLTVS